MTWLQGGNRARPGVVANLWAAITCLPLLVVAVAFWLVVGLVAWALWGWF
jgi:hypothetical protein